MSQSISSNHTISLSKHDDHTVDCKHTKIYTPRTSHTQPSFPPPVMLAPLASESRGDHSSLSSLSSESSAGCLTFFFLALRVTAFLALVCKMSAQRHSLACCPPPHTWNGTQSNYKPLSLRLSPQFPFLSWLPFDLLPRTFGCTHFDSPWHYACLHAPSPPRHRRPRHPPPHPTHWQPPRHRPRLLHCHSRCPLHPRHPRRPRHPCAMHDASCVAHGALLPCGSACEIHPTSRLPHVASGQMSVRFTFFVFFTSFSRHPKQSSQKKERES